MTETTTYNITHNTPLDLDVQRKKLHIEMASFLYGCAGVATIFLTTFKLADHFPSLSWWALPIPLLVATAFLIARLAIPYIVVTLAIAAIAVGFVLFLAALAVFVATAKLIELLVCWWPKGRAKVRASARSILDWANNGVKVIKVWAEEANKKPYVVYAR